MVDKEKYLEKIAPKFKRLGFASFEEYMSARLPQTLKEIAKELGEPYCLFQKFHCQYIRGLKNDGN